MLERSANASEQRLKSKLSLGIGGHLNPIDIGSESMGNWGAREFAEEVEYAGTYRSELLGMINEESTPVGQVHTGFAFLLHGDSDNIAVRSELKSGRFCTLEECQANYDRLENWSQFIVDALAKQAR